MASAERSIARTRMAMNDHCTFRRTKPIESRQSDMLRRGDHIDNLEGTIPSDTVNIEVNADFYRCFRSSHSRLTAAALLRITPVAQGTGALMDMMSNIGPIAMCRARPAADRQSLLVDRHSGQDCHLPQGNEREPKLYPRLSQGHAPAGDFSSRGQLQGQPAGAGLRRSVRNLQAPDRRLRTAAQPDPAGALGADRGQRSRSPLSNAA